MTRPPTTDKVEGVDAIRMAAEWIVGLLKRCRSGIECSCLETVVECRSLLGRGFT